MRTLLEAILNKHEISIRDAKLSVKDVVVQECDDAQCVKTIKGIPYKWYKIKSGSKVLGTGSTIDNAWENAALKILSINC